MDLAINLDYILFICLHDILSINQVIDIGIVQMSYVFKELLTYLFLRLYVCMFIKRKKNRMINLLIDNPIVHTFEAIKLRGY